MIYSNGQVVKSPEDIDFDSLYKFCMESCLFSMKNYNQSLEEIMEMDIKSLNSSLNEAFSIKNIVTVIINGIKAVFAKIIEIYNSIELAFTSAFYASDQLLIKTHGHDKNGLARTGVEVFREKAEKYGRNMRYKIAMPNPDKHVFGSNGSEFSNKVLASVTKVIKDYVSASDPSSVWKDRDVEDMMNKLRGEIIGKGSLTQKEFKEELDKSLIIENSGVGITTDIVNHVIKTMHLSTKAIKNSWSKSAQQQMKALINEVNNLYKINQSDESSLANIKAYVNGALHIINVINMSYVTANIKFIRDARKLFLHVSKTFMGKSTNNT